MLPTEFLTLSQQIGANPLLVQGPGGNTSIKQDGRMWIKASGTELSDALDEDIFVAVDPDRALAELDGAGDGSCRSALIDSDCGLRPSIETTFHALFPQRFVFHYHSVATICHAIAVEGRAALAEKLDGLSWVAAPYRKPGIPLTRAIREAVGTRDASVVVLENHGVIIAGEDIDTVRGLIDETERRLDFPILAEGKSAPGKSVFQGWEAVSSVSALVDDAATLRRAASGTYYPDHVVFLGPALPLMTADDLACLDLETFPAPVVLVEGQGVYAKTTATAAQRAMLDCIYQVLARIPADWTLEPIGEAAEAELLKWDAEKYRQALAKRNA